MQINGLVTHAAFHGCFQAVSRLFPGCFLAAAAGVCTHGLSVVGC